MEILGYVAAILMGLSLGLIGGGGSILTVPILVYLFGRDPVAATADSLFIVGSTALVGGLLALRQGRVDVKTGLLFAVPSFIGVFLTRAYLVPSLPDPVFQWGDVAFSKALLVMLVFALLMITASISMIRQKKSNIERVEMAPWKRITLILAEGLLVGGVTGFVGAGGGFLIIPALVLLVGLPMKKAVGTSLLIIAVKSLIGFSGDLQHSTNIDWSSLILITIIAVVGLFVGVRFSSRVSETTLKKGFGYFVLLMGTVILLDQIRHL